MGVWVLLAALVDVFDHRRKFQRSDVLGIVERVGMVCGMGGDGVGVVVDAGYHSGALAAVELRALNTSGRAACTAKQVDVK